MFQINPIEISCYQITGILKNRNAIKEKATQNSPYYVNEAVSPVSYEYKSKRMGISSDENSSKNTERDKKYLCKCKGIKRKHNNKTNNSSRNNDNHLKSAYLDDKSNELYRVDDTSKNVTKKIIYNLFSKNRGTYKVNPRNKSLISLYRKRKNNNSEIQNDHKSRETDVIPTMDEAAKIKNSYKNSSKKTKKVKFTSVDRKSPRKDSILQPPKVKTNEMKNNVCKCNTNKENSKPIGREQGTYNKNTKLLRLCDECNVCRHADDNLLQSSDNTTHLSKLGAGDQITKLKIKRKCKNALSGIFNRCHVQRKCKTVQRVQPQPMFAVRVDSANLEVLNSAEIQSKVKALGRVEKNKVCMCPSRLEKAKIFGLGDACEAGVCEIGGKDRYNRFNCKCVKKTLVECNDTTCDDQTGHKSNIKGNVGLVTSSPTSNTPMFKMVLDSNYMNVLNTDEIEDVLKKTSRAGFICPTGVCNEQFGNKRAVLNCKCINKKLEPTLYECDEKTCQPKRSRFYILCERIFSGSDRWFCGNRYRRSYYPNTRLPYEFGPSTDQVRGLKSINRNNRLVTRDRRVRRNLISNKADIDCMCNCECYTPQKKTHKHKKSKKHKKHKRKSSSLFQRDTMIKNYHQREKEFTKLQKQKAREERKKEKIERKIELKKRREMEKLALKEERDSNFLANLINGIINLTMQTIRGVFKGVISIIFDPINSYLYAKDRVKDPFGTAKIFKRWLVDTWKSKDSKLSKTITDSDALNVLADHLEESAIFQTFANKGRTETERHIYQHKSKLRKRRMRKRKDLALYGCRHMLLTTLRKHPCLWVYHICPNFYPQCLSLLSFCGNFFHIILFLGALLCWTPCIMMMELCRACLCCIVCTQ